jgi:hypothetical protein
MEITFTRTGERRYRVVARREAAPDLVMEPAPGFDSHLPHDLVHFLVEGHWKLREGIYGDLAAGGDAGTFRPLEVARDRRWAKKHAGLATSGRDMDRSEVLAAATFAAWSQHAGRVPRGSEYARTAASNAGATAEELAAILPACDEAAQRWHSLGVGDSMTYQWPDGDGYGRHTARAGVNRRR